MTKTIERRGHTQPLPEVDDATRREFLIGVAGLLLLPAGCGSNRGDESGTPRETRTVKHALGETEVPARPERIASVSISVTGPLLAVGAPVIGSQGDEGVSGDPSGFFPAWADVARERGVQLLYQGFEPDLEAVAAARPDVIVGSADDGGSVANPVYDELSRIAPTVSFNLNDKTWQETMIVLAQAVGREEAAREEAAEYESLEREVASTIALPPQPTTLASAGPPGEPNFFLIPPDFSTARVLAGVGFDIVEPPGWEGGPDFVPVSQELVAENVTGRSLFYVELSGSPRLSEVREQPLWSRVPAIRAGRAYALPFEVLRPDPYVAPELLRDLEERFA